MLHGFVRMDSVGMSLNFGIAKFFSVFLLNMCVLSLLHFGSGCSTAVEHSHHNIEIVGLYPAGC